MADVRQRLGTTALQYYKRLGTTALQYYKRLGQPLYDVMQRLGQPLYDAEGEISFAGGVSHRTNDIYQQASHRLDSLG